MSTVVVRFEPCKNTPSRGAIYYRIYKGHNRRMEFSSHINILTSSWDNEAKTVKGESINAYRFRAQIEEDLKLLRRIIEEDTAGVMSMGDIKNAFKRRRRMMYSDGL